ncbi:MAG: hypothetical protein HYV28_08355 [Ignavibacteriales bacterium]|nr:hypothetical protein [Ignavibacteriales bacterium]
MRKFSGKKIALIPVFVIGGIALFGYIVMLLWNALMPAIFNLASISFWQALGLLVLSKILFGGFSGHHKHSGRRHFSQKDWNSLSDEEREKIRTGWRRYCCTTEEKE